MSVNTVVFAQSENQLIKTAKSAYLKENYKNALEGYRQLLSNDLTNIEYNYRYAVCLFYTKSPKSSEKYFNYLLEQSDCPIEVFYFKGRLNHLNYEFDDAIEMYSNYIRLKTKKSTDYKCADEIMRCQNAKELLKSPRAIQVLSQEGRTVSDYFSAYLFDSINFKLYTNDDFNKKVNNKKGFSPKYVFKRGMKYRFFSSYTNDGLNGKEIYYQKKNKNNEWDAPELMPISINSTFDEDYPFYDEEANFLYFSSSGHNSMGGFDLFRVPLSLKTMEIGGVENLNFPYSSTSNDFLFIPNLPGDNIFFSTDRNEDIGSLKVVEAKFNAPVLSSLVASLFFKDAIDPNNKSATFFITNERSKERFGPYKTNVDGIVYFMVPTPGVYLFEANITGSQISFSEVVDIPPHVDGFEFEINATYEMTDSKEVLSYDQHLIELSDMVVDIESIELHEFEKLTVNTKTIDVANDIALEAAKMPLNQSQIDLEVERHIDIELELQDRIRQKVKLNENISELILKNSEVDEKIEFILAKENLNTQDEADSLNKILFDLIVDRKVIVSSLINQNEYNDKMKPLDVLENSYEELVLFNQSIDEYKAAGNKDSLDQLLKSTPYKSNLELAGFSPVEAVKSSLTEKEQIKAETQARIAELEIQKSTLLISKNELIKRSESISTTSEWNKIADSIDQLAIEIGALSQAERILIEKEEVLEGQLIYAREGLLNITLIDADDISNPILTEVSEEDLDIEKYASAELYVKDQIAARRKLENLRSDQIQERSRIEQSVLERNIKDSIALVSEYKHINTLNEYKDQEALVSTVRVNSLRSDAETIIEELQNKVEVKHELALIQSEVPIGGENQTEENLEKPKSLSSDALTTNTNDKTDATKVAKAEDVQLEKSFNNGVNTALNTNDEQLEKLNDVQDESIVESITNEDLNQSNQQGRGEISNNEIIDDDQTNSKKNTVINESSSSDPLTKTNPASRDEGNETLVSQTESTPISNESTNPDSILFQKKTDGEQQNEMNSLVGEIKGGINASNTSESIAESTNQNSSIATTSNESKNNNVVNDISDEGKTISLDLSESENEAAQRPPLKDNEDQVANSETQQTQVDAGLTNNDLNILNKEEEGLSNNILPNSNEEINFENNIESNVSEEIIQSNTEINESSVSAVNEKISNDEGINNTAASSQELTRVKSNTASTDDEQQIQNEAPLENRVDNSVSDSASETDANEQKSLTNSESIESLSNEEGFESETKSAAKNLVLTATETETLTQEQEANADITQEVKEVIEMNTREESETNVTSDEVVEEVNLVSSEEFQKPNQAIESEIDLKNIPEPKNKANLSQKDTKVINKKEQDEDNVPPKNSEVSSFSERLADFDFEAKPIQAKEFDESIKLLTALILDTELEINGQTTNAASKRNSDKVKALKLKNEKEERLAYYQKELDLELTHQNIENKYLRLKALLPGIQFESKDNLSAQLLEIAIKEQDLNKRLLNTTSQNEINMLKKLIQANQSRKSMIERELEEMRSFEESELRISSRTLSDEEINEVLATEKYLSYVEKRQKLEEANELLNSLISTNNKEMRAFDESLRNSNKSDELTSNQSSSVKTIRRLQQAILYLEEEVRLRTEELQKQSASADYEYLYQNEMNPSISNKELESLISINEIDEALENSEAKHSLSKYNTEVISAVNEINKLNGSNDSGENINTRDGLITFSSAGNINPEDKNVKNETKLLTEINNPISILASSNYKSYAQDRVRADRLAKELNDLPKNVSSSQNQQEITLKIESENLDEQKIINEIEQRVMDKEARKYKTTLDTQDVLETASFVIERKRVLLEKRLKQTLDKLSNEYPSDSLGIYEALVQDAFTEKTNNSTTLVRSLKSLELKDYTSQDVTITDFTVLSPGAVTKNKETFKIDASNPSGLNFRVQVGAFRRPVRADVYREFTPVSGQKLPNGLIVYMAGYFNNSQAAISAQKEIRSMGYTDAFIVAYCNDERLAFWKGKEYERNGNCISIGDNNFIVSNDKNSGSSSSQEVNNSSVNIVNQSNVVSNSESKVSNSNKNIDNVVSSAAQSSETGKSITEVQAGRLIGSMNISGLFYSVQVGAFNRKIRGNELSQIRELDFYESKGLYRYSSGKFETIDAARVRRAEVVENGVADAFVVVYYNGKRITMQKARELLNSKGNDILFKKENVLTPDRKVTSEEFIDANSTSSELNENPSKKITLKTNETFTSQLKPSEVKDLFSLKLIEKQKKKTQQLIMYSLATDTMDQNSIERLNRVGVFHFSADSLQIRSQLFDPSKVNSILSFYTNGMEIKSFDEEQYEMYSVKLKSSITGALGDWLVRSNRIIRFSQLENATFIHFYVANEADKKELIEELKEIIIE